jgi:hypothetical protein
MRAVRPAALAAALVLGACGVPPVERVGGTGDGGASGAAAAPAAPSALRAPSAGPSAPGATRAEAARAVTEVAAARFPGVSAAPFAECVVAAATPAELRALAATAGQGAPDPAVATVRDVVQRKAALDCILAAGLGPALVATQQGAS